MIAVDSNLLIYAHRTDSDWNAAAAAAIRSLAEGASWAIPWPCLYEFFNIVTHPRRYRPPSTAAQALRQIEIWRSSPTLTLLAETTRSWDTLSDLLRESKVVGPKVHDARIAALCLQHGVNELWSADRDFSRFPQLRVVNPLIPTRANERRAPYVTSASRAATRRTAAGPRSR